MVMGSYHSIRNPPKYYCQGCGRGFRRRKQHDDHILLPNRFGQPRCKAMRKQNNSKTIAVVQQQVEPELVSMKDEFIYLNPQTTKYYGRAYAFNNIPTGNRHLRTGIPLPRISSYRRAAI